jgi:phosphoribosyl 1,2-cyclic phosphodiesterase
MYGFCPLASGSKGNAIFIGTRETRILLDAGLTAAQLCQRLEQIGIAPDTLDALIISHEHIDHIRGLAVFAKRYKLPVLANSETARAIIEEGGEGLRFKIFATGEPFVLGDLEIKPFSVPHDTLDPVAFTVRHQQYKAAFCTDLGHATSLVKSELEKSHYLYLEANHEPSMVHASSRPAVYKQRVLGRQGHLSNHDAAALLAAVRHPGLKAVYLAHLSSECNAPAKALEVITPTLPTVPFHIALQEAPSPPILWGE